MKISENINYLFAAIGTQLYNNVGKFAERFRFEAFQNSAGARIETERPTFPIESWPNISTSLSKNCVQRQSSFLAQWIRK